MAKVKQKKISKSKSSAKAAVKKTTKSVTATTKVKAKVVPKVKVTKKPAKAAVAKPAKKSKVPAKAASAKMTKSTAKAPTTSSSKKAISSLSSAKANKSRTQSASKATATHSKATVLAMPQITPLDDRVVIAVPREKEAKSAGGLILLNPIENEGLLKGKVLRVGRGHRDKKGRIRPIALKAGDWVLLNSYTGTEVHVDQQTKILIVRETDVLGLAAGE